MMNYHALAIVRYRPVLSDIQTVEKFGFCSQKGLMGQNEESTGDES